MEEKKYEFTGVTKVVKLITVREIKYLKDIPLHNIKKGDIGGYIEKEDNLHHLGESAVKGNAVVTGTSMVTRKSLVTDDALIQNTTLSGDVIVSGDCYLVDTRLQGNNIHIKDDVYMKDADLMGDNILLEESTQCRNVYCRTQLYDFTLTGRAVIEGVTKATPIGGKNIYIGEKAQLIDTKALLGEDIYIRDNARVGEETTIKGKGIRLGGFSEVTDGVVVSDNVNLSEYARLFSQSGKSQKPVMHMELMGDIALDVDTL